MKQRKQSVKMLKRFWNCKTSCPRSKIKSIFGLPNLKVKIIASVFMFINQTLSKNVLQFLSKKGATILTPLWRLPLPRQRDQRNRDLWWPVKIGLHWITPSSTKYYTMLLKITPESSWILKLCQWPLKLLKLQKQSKSL